MAYTMFDDAAYEVQKQIKKEKRRAQMGAVSDLFRTLFRKKTVTILRATGETALQIARYWDEIRRASPANAELKVKMWSFIEKTFPETKSGRWSVSQCGSVFEIEEVTA